MYASGLNNDCITKIYGYYFSGYNNNNPECGISSNDWMTPTSSSWSLTLSSNDETYTLYLNLGGSVGGATVGNNFNALPAVILKSSVRIVSGDGMTPETAYVLQ